MASTYVPGPLNTPKRRTQAMALLGVVTLGAFANGFISKLPPLIPETATGYAADTVALARPIDPYAAGPQPALQTAAAEPLRKSSTPAPAAAPQVVTEATAVELATVEPLATPTLITLGAAPAPASADRAAADVSATAPAAPAEPTTAADTP